MILPTLLACAATKPSPPSHTGTPGDAHSASGGSGAAAAHSGTLEHTGYGCGGLFSFPGTTTTGPLVPDRPLDQEVCLTTRSLAERCAASSWGPLFGGCPDLPTLRAAIEAGVVDPLGAGILEARVHECNGPDGTWTSARFLRRNQWYDAEEYGAWFDPTGALSVLVEDWGPSYDGGICCSGTVVESVWYGVAPPAGLTCVAGTPIRGPLTVDSGGSGR
jgi:hypothetical protein